MTIRSNSKRLFLTVFCPFDVHSLFVWNKSIVKVKRGKTFKKKNFFCYSVEYQVSSLFDRDVKIKSNNYDIRYIASEQRGVKKEKKITVDHEILSSEDLKFDEKILSRRLFPNSFKRFILKSSNSSRHIEWVSMFIW